jgi:hypothetical protein
VQTEAVHRRLEVGTIAREAVVGCSILLQKLAKGEEGLRDLVAVRYPRVGTEVARRLITYGGHVAFDIVTCCLIAEAVERIAVVYQLLPIVQCARTRNVDSRGVQKSGLLAESRKLWSTLSVELKMKVSDGF